MGTNKREETAHPINKHKPPRAGSGGGGESARACRMQEVELTTTGSGEEAASRAGPTVWRPNASWVRAMPSSSRARMASIAQYVWGLS